jgi:hypothetical protein
LDSPDEARRRWRYQRLHESTNFALNFLTLIAEKFSSTFFFETLKGRDVGAEDELVDVLNKIFVKLLALLVLIRPVVSVGLGINAVNLLMVFNQSIDGVICEFVGDLILQNHIDMNNISLNMDELIVSDGLYERIADVSLEPCLVCLG